MAFYLSNGWSLAQKLGSEAFVHLGNACKINLAAKGYINSIPPETNIVEVYTTLDLRYISENIECIKGTILFQAAMESWISWAYTESKMKIYKPRNFNEKWEKAFIHLNVTHDFKEYLHFYNDCRNPIVHSSKPDDLDKVAKIKSADLYAGFKASWQAKQALSLALDMPFDPNSWEIMCSNKDVILPNRLSELIDINDVKEQSFKRFQASLKE